MGEHAVLHGYPALVCAINKRMRIKLTPRADTRIVLRSTLGTHETTLDELAPNESFRFVMGTIRAMQAELAQGFELTIRSEMSHQMGLGTSAAVTAAALAALWGALGRPLDPAQMLTDAVDIIRKKQGGVGSGADVAASIHGGCLRYFAETREIVKLPTAPKLTVLYSGSKMPTPEVIAFVDARRKRHGAVFAAIEALMGDVVQQAFAAATRDDWETVGELMNINQGLMDALGVNNVELSELVYELRKDPTILGSKISGSGLGDCVVGLGKAMRQEWGVPAVSVEVDAQGVLVSGVETP